ncbi:hypothetical protein GCM10023178_46460 [Actinomadura luteofluorescens]
MWAEALRETLCTAPWGQGRYPESKAGLANETGDVDFGPLPGGRGRARKPDPDPVADVLKPILGVTDSGSAPQRPIT